MYEFVLLKGKKSFPIRVGDEGYSIVLIKSDGFYILQKNFEGSGYRFYRISINRSEKTQLLLPHKARGKFVGKVYEKLELIEEEVRNKKRVLYKIPNNELDVFVKDVMMTKRRFTKDERESFIYEDFIDNRLPSS